VILTHTDLNVKAFYQLSQNFFDIFYKTGTYSYWVGNTWKFTCKKALILKVQRLKAFYDIPLFLL